LTIKSANIHFNANGTPYAEDFDDVYYSDALGLAETRYVFIANNALRERWSNCQNKEFVIAETGFGTGLNFLVTLAEFENFCHTQQNSNLCLHFISVEKFPLTKADLQSALSHFPELKESCEQLIVQYPMGIAGCHRLSFFAGRVILDLWLGDVHEVLPKIVCSASGLINAWYLDGFAPSKNPEMWTELLFEQMARLAAANCTFATFTAAGSVKRGLKNAGFVVNKRPGHGRKRDMLAGTIDPERCNRRVNKIHAPYFKRNHSVASNAGSRVAIIGGGIAGANCAYALSKRGFKISVYCKEHSLAQGASSIAQGAFHPQLNAEASIPSQIYALAFNYASQQYFRLLAEGFDFAHQWCGVLQVSFSEKVKHRQRKLVANNTWPKDLIHWLEAEKAQQLCQVPMPYPGLFVPQGGWINPPELVHALIEAAKRQSDCQVQNSKKLETLSNCKDGWQLNWQDGTKDFADIVVLATGGDGIDIQQIAGLPLRLARGQVEAIGTQAPMTGLSTVLSHKGYLTPEYKGQHALGSTYVKNDRDCGYRDEEEQDNLAMHKKSLPNCAWLQSVKGEHQGQAAIRCSSPDHLPLVGAVPNILAQKHLYNELYKSLPMHRYAQATDLPNLFMLGALGFRGLTSAPLLAEVLASQISAQAMPLAYNLLNALNPNRFLIRDLIRRKVETEDVNEVTD
jgi:tRNA 5-methylaminomethyl-2-thiouridine biosynthesis bifunctional protein